MKILKLLNGVFINFDEFLKVDYEELEIRKQKIKCFSYIHLKNGERYDFIDETDSFQDEYGINHVIDGDIMITWHNHTLRLILEDENVLVNLEEVMEESWDLTMREWIDLQKKEVASGM